ncbi:MAG: hypothetical protein M1839_005302, partial [Geoglossum umbratile]
MDPTLPTINVQIPEFLVQHLQLDKKFLILLCLHCNNALLPTAVNYHLRRNIGLPKDIVNAATEFAKQLPSYTNDTLPLYPDNSLPISEWPIIEGFQCRRCNFRSRRKRSVFDHTTKEHGMKGFLLEARLEEVLLQAWFSDNRAKYWKVKSMEEVIEEQQGSTREEDEDIEANISIQTRIDILKKEKRRNERLEERRQILDINNRPDDKDYWLIRTQWKQLFAGRNLKTISAAKRVPDEEESNLVWICLAFDNVVLRAMETVRETPREALRWLMSVRQDEPH